MKTLKIGLAILFFGTTTASADNIRICTWKTNPGSIYVGNQWVTGIEMEKPFGLQNSEQIDRCIKAEIPPLIALSRTLQDMPDICSLNPACQYDRDGDGAVGLGDISIVIVDALSKLGQTCPEKGEK